MESRASSLLLMAWINEFLWRTLFNIPSFEIMTCPWNTSSLICSFKVSIPIFCDMEVWMTISPAMDGSSFGFQTEGKSVLLSRRILFFSLLCSKIIWSSSVRGRLKSRSTRTKSACCMISLERLTPICSTMSSVSRIPAVSMMRRGTPSMVIISSMISRVVPSISVTMARCSCKISFRREDLPTFGFPMMAVFSPSFSNRPVSKVSRSCFISVWQRSILSFNSS